MKEWIKKKESCCQAGQPIVCIRHSYTPDKHIYTDELDNFVVTDDDYRNHTYNSKDDFFVQQQPLIRSRIRKLTSSETAMKVCVVIGESLEPYLKEGYSPHCTVRYLSFTCSLKDRTAYRTNLSLGHQLLAIRNLFLIHNCTKIVIPVNECSTFSLKGHSTLAKIWNELLVSIPEYPYVGFFDSITFVCNSEYHYKAYRNAIQTFTTSKYDINID